MTLYHGGKQKIGKEIASIIQQATDEVTYVGYCEPFCGMLGVFQHIPALLKCKSYLAGDAQESVIKMWKAAQKGWVPPRYHVSKEEFDRLSETPNSSALKGFVGNQYGMRGKYFKTYLNRNGSKASDNVVRIANIIGDTKFSNNDYTQYSNLKYYIIYCDPPYKKQNSYYGEQHDKRYFDNSSFWEWCRKMSEYNYVFISEYEAPEDFECIWEDIKGEEKLFRLIE